MELKAKNSAPDEFGRQPTGTSGERMHQTQMAIMAHHQKSSIYMGDQRRANKIKKIIINAKSPRARK